MAKNPLKTRLKGFRLEQTKTIVPIPSVGRGEVPEFEELLGVELAHFTEQEWFVEWCSERIGSSFDPVLEVAIITQALQNFDARINTDFLANLTPERFRDPRKLEGGGGHYFMNQIIEGDDPDT